MQVEGGLSFDQRSQISWCSEHWHRGGMDLIALG
jgi:hypothetical protein